MEIKRFFANIAHPVITLLMAPSYFAAAPPEREPVDAEVQFKMGVGYFRAGESAEAIRWLKQAAKANHTRAQGMLGLCHYSGRGVPLDYDKAAYWLARAAAKEDAIAQFSLARLYVNGQGVPRNLVKASELYLLAANQGHAAAQINLGAIQERGSGTPRNLESAAKWYAKAAQQGLAAAQLNLGRMHSTGRGVKQDHALAAKWYAAAAEQGLGRAQFLLGASLYLGEGVPQDFEKAYKWMNLAAAQGIEAALEHRQTITDKLTAQQLANAQQETAQFVARRRAVTRGRGEFYPIDQAGALPDPSTGTGFFITTDGYIITNHHVVTGAQRIEVRTGNQKLLAHMIKGDLVNDLALLKVKGQFDPLPLGDSRITRLGEPVFTIGFPNTTVQGVKPKYSAGRINSRSGMQDDQRQFQIDAPLQPGNSGGALINEANGNVIGVITCRLDDLKTFNLTGSLPQNVNYALKAEVIHAFVQGAPKAAAKLIPPSPRARPTEAVHQTAEAATVLISVQR